MIKINIKVTALLALITLCQACYRPYVDIEPTYSEGVRPLRPSNEHVWIDGDWSWRRSSHSYYKNSGYWSMPSRKRSFVPGRWKKNQHGARWVSGRWERIYDTSRK